MSKIILHIDLNAFFVRCEEIKNPSLEGKPVIIGGVGRAGIVSTCSYAAREKGASSGMPTYRALELCPNAIVLPVDFSLYKAKSQEFFTYLKRYTPIIEKASIDECFADFTDVLKDKKDPKAFLKQMQLDLYKETKLKCSIGVAPTKFLAKMASDMKKPMGLTIIRRRDVRKMLDPLPIEAFFGIGKKTSPKLRQMGINTIGDLAKLVNQDDPEIKNKLGKFFFAIKDWINGYGSDEVSTEPFDPKSVGHSVTLRVDATTVEELNDQIKEICHWIEEDAIKSNKVGKAVQIVLKDNEFKTINRSKQLPKTTNKWEEIYKVAHSLLVDTYDGRPTRLVGVTLQKLQNPHETMEQLSIFDNYDEIKEENATRLLIDELNRQMHSSVFKTAGEALRENPNGFKRGK